MKNALETIKRAKEMLLDELNATESEIVFNNITSFCDCGETSAIEAYDLKSDRTAYIAVCSVCGDDSRFTEEVITFRKDITMKERAYDKLVEEFENKEPEDIVKLLANYLSVDELNEFLEFIENEKI